MIDEGLKEYCTTDKQRGFIDAVNEHGSISKAAKALGYVDHSSVAQAIRAVKARAAAEGFAPDAGINAGIPANQFMNASTIHGKIGENGEFIPTQAWLKNKETKDSDGRIEALIEGIVSRNPVEDNPLPAEPLMNAITNYIIGDHHHGMLAWFDEVLANWDCKISESYFKSALLDCMANMPDTEVGCLVILGDFFHSETFEGVTMKSKNVLDMDGRWPKIYRTGGDMLSWGIEQLRKKHKKVVFIYCAGNHDLLPAITTVDSLKRVYAETEDVEIVDNTRIFIPYVFGQNFFLIHHGHTTKMDKTFRVAIRDHIDLVAKTKHRFGYTGHIHNHKMVDEGMIIESFRILAPQDKWAHDGGYSAGREMQARLYDYEKGHKLTYITDGNT
jgi:hypothetical protein